MKTLSLSGAFVATVLAAAHGCLAQQSIPIVNAGFDQIVGDALAAGEATDGMGSNRPVRLGISSVIPGRSASTPGWTSGSGVLGVSNPASTWFTNVPGGGLIAIIHTGSFSQLLTTNLEPSTRYDLSFLRGQSIIYPRAATSRVELLAGSTVLTSWNEMSQAQLAADSWASESLTYISPATIATNQQLQIRVTGGGGIGQFAVDNFALTATLIPAPAASILLALSGGLCMRRRRDRVC